jgi:hypothetical protein
MFFQNEESHIYRIYFLNFSPIDTVFFRPLTNAMFIGVCGFNKIVNLGETLVYRITLCQKGRILIIKTH